MHRQGQHLLLPVVVNDLGQQAVALGFDPQIRRTAGLQGLALQGAAAEAVDRGDVGAAQLFKGQQQAAAQQRRLLSCLLLSGLHRPQFLQPGREGGIHRRGLQGGGGVAGGLVFQRRQGRLQPGGDPIAQLRSGGLGVGHHQQLPQGPAPLGHQAQHQMGQGEGLAGAGTGLEQVHARGEGKAIGVEAGHQRCPRAFFFGSRAAWIGSNSSWASAANGLSSRSATGSSPPKQASISLCSRSPRLW